jgi:lipoprotein-releasing system permease protein
LISLGMALAATLYPSWRASRINPAQALRYE